MRKAHLIPPFVLLSAMLFSACASLPEEVDHFTYAASSPLRDVNLIREPIPGQLTALNQPYGYSNRNGCQAWAEEIDQLQSAIDANGGRRVGFRRDNDTAVGRTGNLRDVGVKSATSRLIPFRGVVRQVSGAAKHEKVAINASEQARYRIGYLVGLGRAYRCPGFGRITPPTLETTVQTQRITTYPTSRPVQTYRPAPRSDASIPVSRGPQRLSRR